jgi:hypothetical protein
MDPGFVFVLLLLQNRRTGTIPAFALSLIEPSGMGPRGNLESGLDVGAAAS